MFRRDLRNIFTAQPMYSISDNFQGSKEAIVCQFIIAGGIGGGNAAFVGPEEMDLGEGGFPGGRPGDGGGEKVFRDTATRERDTIGPAGAGGGFDFIQPGVRSGEGEGVWGRKVFRVQFQVIKLLM